MALPDIRPLIAEAAEQFDYLLHENTYESCGLFTAIVVARAAALGFGHVGKSSGEDGWNPPNGPRVSHDAIWHKGENQQIDILGNAAAKSTGHKGEATPTWGLIPRHEYRAGNEWVAPVLQESDLKPDPEQPPVVEPPVPPPATGFDFALAFNSLWQRLDQMQADLNTMNHRVGSILQNQHAFTDQLKTQIANERNAVLVRLEEDRKLIVSAVEAIDRNSQCVLARIRR